MLSNIRIKINQIDKEMIDLFIKRIELVKEVLNYKIENNLPIYDEKREIELIKKNIELLNNEELEKYYKIFFDGVLNSSKKFQEDNYE